MSADRTSAVIQAAQVAYVPKTRLDLARIMLSMWVAAATNDFCPYENCEEPKN
jgi:hypothetical protein